MISLFTWPFSLSRKTESDRSSVPLGMLMKSSSFIFAFSLNMGLYVSIEEDDGKARMKMVVWIRNWRHRLPRTVPLAAGWSQVRHQYFHLPLHPCRRHQFSFELPRPFESLPSSSDFLRLANKAKTTFQIARSLCMSCNPIMSFAAPFYSPKLSV